MSGSKQIAGSEALPPVKALLIGLTVIDEPDRVKIATRTYFVPASSVQTAAHLFELCGSAFTWWY